MSDNEAEVAPVKKSPKKTTKGEVSESEEDAAVKFLTPASKKRQSVKVEALVPEVAEKSAFVVPQGEGTALKDIENVEALLRKEPTDNCKIIHRVLFGRAGAKHLVKKNILQFSGVPNDETERSKLKVRLDKQTTAALKDLCQALDLERGGTKPEIVTRVYDFCLKPEASGKPLKEKKRKRSASKSPAAKKKKATPKKKAAATKKATPKKAKAAPKPDEDTEESDGEKEKAESSESEAEESPKKKAKKAAPEKKSPAKAAPKASPKKPAPKKAAAAPKASPKKAAPAKKGENPELRTPALRKRVSGIINDPETDLTQLTLRQVLDTITEQLKIDRSDLDSKKPIIKGMIGELLSEKKEEDEVVAPAKTAKRAKPAEKEEAEEGGGTEEEAEEEEAPPPKKSRKAPPAAAAAAADKEEKPEAEAEEKAEGGEAEAEAEAEAEEGAEEGQNAAEGGEAGEDKAEEEANAE